MAKQSKVQIVREGFRQGKTYAEISEDIIQQYSGTTKLSAGALVATVKGSLKKKGIMVEYGKPNEIPSEKDLRKTPKQEAEDKSPEVEETTEAETSSETAEEEQPTEEAKPTEEQPTEEQPASPTDDDLF